MRNVLPIIITIILIGIAGWGVYMLTTQLYKSKGVPREDTSKEEVKIQPKEKEKLPKEISNEEEEKKEPETPSTSKIAYELSNLTASTTPEAGTYNVSVKVITIEQPGQYAQGYTLKWFIDDLLIIEETRSEITSGEYIHKATLATSRKNPVIMATLTDMYTRKTISTKQNLQTLLSQ